MLNAQTTDPSLIASVRDWRADEGWRRFYEIYAPAIRRLARSSGLGEADVEDVVQETMMKVVRYLPRFEYDRTICRFRTWLNQIVQQRICDARRTHSREHLRREALRALLGWMEGLASPAEPSLEFLESIRLQMEVCLDRVRTQARPDHWQVFEAYALEGLSAAETAARFRTTSANVWVVRHRMVKALKAEWRQWEERPF